MNPFVHDHPTYGGEPESMDDIKKRHILMKLKLHFAMARFRTAYRAAARTTKTLPCWYRSLRQELVRDATLPAFRILTSWQDQVMVILGHCFAGGYHISVPWGIQQLADSVYRTNGMDLYSYLENINSSFNEDQDCSILNMAGEYMAWWLDEDSDTEVNSEVIGVHFEMYVSQVRSHICLSLLLT